MLQDTNEPYAYEHQVPQWKKPVKFLLDRGRYQEALNAAWPYALGFFETTEADAMLAAAGLLHESADRQRAAWEASVRPLFEADGLTIPAATSSAGGRRGAHTPDLAQMHEEMTEEWRSDPEARW